MFAKIFFFVFLFMWIRWTLPRFRYDQLMRLGWKAMIPLALLNMLATGAISLFNAHGF
jgi:NADH-quinone oxidoreductase subunit H